VRHGGHAATCTTDTRHAAHDGHPDDHWAGGAAVITVAPITFRFPSGRHTDRSAS
jgi:hypothetical protein